MCLKYCEACAAAIDESKTNSPTPMNFSTTFRVVSDEIRSKSGLLNQGVDNETKATHIDKTGTYERPDERFTPAKSVVKSTTSAV
jgi:hypothetical protein